ncbi:MAG: DUF1569 domain-containing protein [Ferruginibacter sp.]
MQNIFNQHDYQSILDRIHKISPASERIWGEMEVNQMIVHLKDQLDIALGNMKAAAQGPFFFRTTLVRYLVLYVVDWRKGKEITPKEMDATLKGAVVTDFESDKHLLIIRLQEFTKATSFEVHPFFGKLNKKDWGRLAWKHFNHHLLQFDA